MFFWFVFVLNLHLLSILLCLTQDCICKGWKLFVFLLWKKSSSEFVIASDPFPKRLFWGCCICGGIDWLLQLPCLHWSNLCPFPSIPAQWLVAESCRPPEKPRKVWAFHSNGSFTLYKPKMFLKCRSADRSHFTQKWTAASPMGCCVWHGLGRGAWWLLLCQMQQ